MTAPEIRRITVDEIPGFVDALSTAFLDRPDVDRVAAEVRPHWDLDRTWAAFDGGRVCGTLRSWASEVTVPGGAQLPMAAVAAVTVLPTHRRRGILRAMIAAEQAAMRERGEAVAMLYAAEYPIYGRFGYGQATSDATWALEALGTRFHDGVAAGGVELVRPSEATRDEIRGVFDAWRLRQPGEIRRRDIRWDLDLALQPTAWGRDWKGFLAVHRAASGAADGYVRYHSEEKWERGQPRSILHVDDLHALDDAAHAALWRFLAEIDLVATVRAEGRSPAERLPWLLTNARAASLVDVGDGVWLRLLDVVRALETRRWERAGRLVLEVIDAEARGGRLRLQLDASPEGARARTTTASPDLTLDVAALGAAYLGGSRLRDAVIASGADEHRTDALAEADALLRTLDEPWCSTHF